MSINLAGGLWLLVFWFLADEILSFDGMAFSWKSNRISFSLEYFEDFTWILPGQLPITFPHSLYPMWVRLTALHFMRLSLIAETLMVLIVQRACDECREPCAKLMLIATGFWVFYPRAVNSNSMKRAMWRLKWIEALKYQWIDWSIWIFLG